MTEMIPISELNLDLRNDRKHPERNLAAIKLSMSKYGQQRPILISQNNDVIAGNGTVMAARELGWTEIEAKRSDLQGNDIRAYAIADNRTAELAEWDVPVLLDHVAELRDDEYDLSATGWTDQELAKLGETDDEPQKVRSIKLTDEQWEVVRRAIEEMKANELEDDMSDGRALELIAADWMS